MESSETETESAETMSTETESGTGRHLQGKTNFLDTTKNDGHAAKSGQNNVFCDTIFSAIDCA